MYDTALARENAQFNTDYLLYKDKVLTKTQLIAKYPKRAKDLTNLAEIYSVDK
jgi:hypothetical protein